MAAGSKYDDRRRRDAVAQYLLLGSVEAVALATRIPATTLRDWMASPWWGPLSVEVRAANGRLDTHLTRGMLKSLRLLEERLDEGDPMVGKNGKVRGHRPLRARDIAFIAGSLLDRQNEIEKHLGLQPAEASKRIPVDKLADILNRYAEKELIPAIRRREPLDA